MKTAVLIVGVMRQAHIAAVSWRFPFPVDFHLITWDKIQQNCSTWIYPLTDEVEKLEEIFSKLGKTLTSKHVLDYDDFSDKHQGDRFTLRTFYQWRYAFNALKNHNYDRVILIRPDLFMSTLLLPSSREYYDVSDSFILTDSIDPKRRLLGDWFFTMSWKNFDEFSNVYHTVDRIKEVHAFMWDYWYQKCDVQQIRGVQFQIVRPNSRHHAGTPYSRKLFLDIKEERFEWDELIGPSIGLRRKLDNMRTG